MKSLLSIGLAIAQVISDYKPTVFSWEPRSYGLAQFPVSKKLNPGLVPKPLHEKQAFPEDTYRVRFESRNICRHDQEESTNTLQRINTHTPSQVKVIRLWVALFFAGKAHERLPGLPRADGASRSTS